MAHIQQVPALIEAFLISASVCRQLLRFRPYSPKLIQAWAMHSAQSQELRTEYIAIGAILSERGKG